MPQNKKNNKRQRAQRWGYWAEWLAAASLMIKGYRILTLRYKTKLGEIDLIAKKGDLVAIVEVKARPTVSEAVNSVTDQSKIRIENAADLWLAKQRNPHLISMRFDIIAVRPWAWPTHFKNAF